MAHVTSEPIRDKVVLITGGAGEIGTAMVKELLNHGVKGISIVDQSEEAGEKILDVLRHNFGTEKAIFVKTDISKENELKAAFDKTIDKFHQLDMVINNAGLMDEIQWKRTVSVNFTALTESSLLAMQKYLPEHKSGKEGVIVNVASELGLCVLESVPVYCATKHAVVGLGQTLGSQPFYEKFHVRVVTLCPGIVKTQMVLATDENRFWFPQLAQQHNENLKDIIQTPEHVAKALIEVIQKGGNGSLWVAKAKQPAFEVVRPSVESMRVP